MRFRQIIFWLHLFAGVIAGGVILVMCVTGAALAFEKEIIAWVERDARHAPSPDAAAKALPLDNLLARVRDKAPGERPSGITMNADPGAALLVSFGRTNSFYVNAYTGEVREPGAKGTRAFMHVMIDLHRYLGGHDERRTLGKAITGACNGAFLFLAVSGLYIWWPRHWTRAALRAIGVVNLHLRGKARDWNWHNAVGLWTAPVLIVLTATALPISYRWAGDLIYHVTGSTPPASGGAGAASGLPVEIPTPPPGAKPLGMDALLAKVQSESPGWIQITLQTGGRRGPRGSESTNAIPNAPTGEDRRASGRPESSAPASGGESRRPNPQAVTASVKFAGQWPLFASTQLTLDPFTGDVLRREAFGDWSLGRQVRSWTRFLHTGEALGVVGKAVAGLASAAAAAVLVWTGLALSWRRFFPRRNRESLNAETPGAQAAAKQ